MLFTLQVVLHLPFLLESFLAQITPELLDDDFFKVTSLDSILFFASVLLSQLFTILFETFSFSKSFLFPDRVHFSPLGFFRLLLLPHELLHSLVQLFDVGDQILEFIIEPIALLIAFFLVVVLDESFDAAIGGVSWIVQIDKRELLHGGKRLPEPVEVVHLISVGVFVAELWCIIMRRTHVFLHFFFMVKSLEQFAVYRVKVFLRRVSKVP